MKKILFVLSAAIVSACSVSKKQYTSILYEDVQPKSDEVKAFTYTIPSVTPTSKTIQNQNKGGVSISVEIEPFTVKKTTIPSKSITLADPSKPGFDRYEVVETPEFKVTPDRVKFKIRIRNNEQVPLILERIGFMLNIDGVQFSFPKEQIDEWNKGMVLSGFEKTFEILGPQISEIKSGQTVFLFLNGVPVSYNSAGNITKKSNFEWYFVCSNEQKTVEEKITYKYEFVPIHKEQCKSCIGKGYTSSYTACGLCSGTGKIRNDAGVYQCAGCAGSGKREIRHKCNNCNATGSLTFQKSPMPKVTSSEMWTGWTVKLSSNPSGIPVRIVNVKSGKYENAGLTNCNVNWYNSNKKNCPIIVDYQGSEFKFMPIKANGKESKSMHIDFTSGQPIVTGGTRINQ